MPPRPNEKGRSDLKMPLFNRIEDEEKYREWLREHHDVGFVLNCYYYPNGEVAMLHLPACETLLAHDDFNHTGPKFAKKCGIELDDLLNWAACELAVKVKGCSCLRGLRLISTESR